MRQFDVFVNPLPRARRLLPFVVLLQSDRIEAGRDRVIAPLAPRANLPALNGRLLPIVLIEAREYGILVPGLATVRAPELKGPIANLAGERSRIVDALDYLFLGI